LQIGVAMARGGQAGSQPVEHHPAGLIRRYVRQP